MGNHAFYIELISISVNCLKYGFSQLLSLLSLT